MNRSIVRLGLMSVLLLSFAAASHAQVSVGISVRFGPPPIPVYAQPICPGPGYFWTPGYWSWSDDDGYYWVPGTWVVAPVGMYWTPGYWGWGGGFYSWHSGYWGPHVGFYGGINYGFGYT
ncbi:MAG TPA: YXWGXW repeat-containing protein, partial [Candidatus Acidoferrum sp.]|nr:YXWGXW repeat-containing protein [Candidatus Acidoferrum sp.]